LGGAPVGGGGGGGPGGGAGGGPATLAASSIYFIFSNESKQYLNLLLKSTLKIFEKIFFEKTFIFIRMDEIFSEMDDFFMGSFLTPYLIPI